MIHKKRKSGVYLQNFISFMSVTKIMFIILMNSSVIAADNKCKFTSKKIENCDQPRLKYDSDYDNEILLTSMNPFRLQELEQRNLGIDPEDVVSKTIFESDFGNDVMYLEQLIDYYGSPDTNLTNGRNIDSSNGRLLFFKGNCSYRLSCAL